MATRQPRVQHKSILGTLGIEFGEALIVSRLTLVADYIEGRRRADPIPVGRITVGPAPESEILLAFLVILSIAQSLKRSFYLASLCTIKREKKK